MSQLPVSFIFFLNVSVNLHETSDNLSFNRKFQGPIVVLYLHILDQSHQSLGIETNTKHSTYICGENINVA